MASWLAVAILIVTVSSLVVTSILSLTYGQDLASDLADSQLSGRATVKAEEVTRYLNAMRRQTAALAASDGTVTALRRFTDAYQRLDGVDTAGLDEAEGIIDDFYRDRFTPALEQTLGVAVGWRSLVPVAGLLAAEQLTYGVVGDPPRTALALALAGIAAPNQVIIPSATAAPQPRLCRKFTQLAVVPTNASIGSPVGPTGPDWHNAPVTVTYPAIFAMLELGESDCEDIGAGLLNQPVNAWSSVAYIVFGLWLVVRSVRSRSAETPVEIAYGAALASIGIGSVAFHGPVPPAARLMHDLTIAAALTVIAARSVATLRGWTPWRVLATSGIIVAVIGAVMAVAPDVGNMLTGAIGVAAVVSEVVLYRTGRRRFSSRVAKILATTVGLLIGAVVINVLGRTGGPLCDPESVFQGHAVWHVLTAASFMLYGYAAFPHTDARQPQSG